MILSHISVFCEESQTDVHDLFDMFGPLIFFLLGENSKYKNATNSHKSLIRVT